ncbi:MAG: zinc ribbon domain-containing protein [Deltaproteobacteria bacterium]|nr:zinc ribbon domain-containing protein [Deltaproteobacteria bacterium]MBI4224589.1 zinc ribbon domain-containing protein [Deltaproteobacteria bacterium]
MPLYEYHCAACQKDHEIIQKFSDPPLTVCPACGGKLEKKLSLSAFQLKGGGWYKDGYSTPPPKKEEKKPAETAVKKEEKPKAAATATPMKSSSGAK